jgi:tetratricopeptide (TPR) repeat protein
LARGTIFELPVPVVALRAMCEDIAGFDKHLERARSLGLLEVGLNGAVRVPRVLGLAGVENGSELAAIGVRVLTREWGKKEGSLNEQQSIEIHRLALLAGDRDIAVPTTHFLINRCLARGCYSEALNICNNTLALWNDKLLNCQLSRIYDHLHNWEKSLELAQQSLDMALKDEDRQTKAAALHQIALIYSKQGKLTESIAIYDDALTIYREIEDWQGVAASQHQIASAYYELGQLNTALELWNGSLNIARKIRDGQAVSNALNQIARIYLDREQWEDALNSCYAAREISIQVENRVGEASALQKIASIYARQEKWTEALNSFNEALVIFREIEDRGSEAACFHEMAQFADKQGDFTQRDRYYLLAMNILVEIGDYKHLIILLCNLGTANENQCLTYYTQALWLCLKLENNLDREIDLIIAIYRRLSPGDPLQALLGTTALYFCQHSPHPDRSSLQQRSLVILSHAANQQGIITTETAFDDWFVQNRLNDPNYFLPALDARLREIIGDNWLFDPKQVG